MNTTTLNIPAFILGINEELEKKAKKKKRCWDGYEPVPGKKPYSEDSCRLAEDKKAEEVPASYRGVRATPEELETFPISLDSFMTGGGTLSFGEVPKTVPKVNPNPALPVKPNTPQLKRPVKKPILQKKSLDLSSMPVNESILPTSTSQLKWKYSRTPNSLRLSDGNLVYSFGIPSDFPEEDTRVERLTDEALTDFEKDIVSKGSAQIHRSSPDNIYLTLNDGRQNPTFMLQHEKDKQWRYSPSKKFVEKLKKIRESLSLDTPENIPVDTAALLEAAKQVEKTANYNMLRSAGKEMGHRFGHSQQQIADNLINTANDTASFGNNAIDFIANHPLESAFGGFLAAKGLSKLYNIFLRNEDDSDEEDNTISNPVAAGLGIAPVVISKYLRNKY